jgi:hypothetical protein
MHVEMPAAVAGRRAPVDSPSLIRPMTAESARPSEVLILDDGIIMG